MTFFSKKYLLIAGIIGLFFTCLFFVIPINLFEGEIVFEINGLRFTEKAKLSLSYFIGIGASNQDTKDVVDFYLLPFGYLNVFLILFCLPLIISYRFYINDIKKNN